MNTPIKTFTLAMLLAGAIACPVMTIAKDHKQTAINTLSSQVATLQSELNNLKKELKHKTRLSSSSVAGSYGEPIGMQLAANTSHSSAKGAAAKKTSTNKLQPAATAVTGQISSNVNLSTLLARGQNYLPFDLDVPGQAFVSSGPYIGVPVQYSGSDLIINSPNVNQDLQLLNIRKSIIEQLNLMGGQLKQPFHSHVLLSGVIEGQANYSNWGGRPSTSDIDVTNMSFDITVFGPSDWLLGFVEFTYDNALLPASNGLAPPNNFFRVFNSRLFVNKAFVTIGNLTESPFYGTFGQFYAPFGSYASLMVSDTLPKLLGRTKVRAIELGFQQQRENSLYGAVYVFRGDAHAASVSKINNGGINLGFKFKSGSFGGNIGGGVIADIADSGGMQVGGGFVAYEQIHHRVPGVNVRGSFDIGKHINILGEFIGVTTRFNPNDLSYDGSGARPWALDAQAAYSFYILNDKPSSVGIGYGQSHQALALGIPLARYSLVFNTSLLRNTLQSIEFRHDRNYAASSFGNGPTASTIAGTCKSITCTASGKSDNVVTAQFDYYF